MKQAQWFEIDKEGLARIIKRRGLQFVPFELIANAWDSKATEVCVTLLSVFGTRQARLVVTDDDPDGFADIGHAYTLFADSCRRGNPLQRGRFNIGEKLVLSVATNAVIMTTTAGLVFNATGRHRTMRRTRKGSEIEVVFPATHKQIEEMLQAMHQLIPPIPTRVNGVLLPVPLPVATFSASLETILPDSEGNLSHYTRKTTAHIQENWEPASSTPDTLGTCLGLGVYPV